MAAAERGDRAERERDADRGQRVLGDLGVEIELVAGVAPTAGDFGAIESHDLPILRVHLGADPDAGLAALERALAAALATPTEA